MTPSPRRVRRSTTEPGRRPRRASARRPARRVADLLQRDKESWPGWRRRTPARRLVESRIDIDDVTAVFRYYAGLAGVEAGRLVDVGDPAVISRVVREPIGVCVLIAPWNYPLLQMSWKVAPALAAGCTMRAQAQRGHPAYHDRTSCSFSRRPGCPPGWSTWCSGGGATPGPPLTDNPRVDFVSFTGGLATGKRTIAKVAAEHVTKVAVELGGKNPHIVFADADCETARSTRCSPAVFLHSGQVCSAGTRLIVEESIADDFVAELVARAEQIRMGDGMDPASETGPLVSEQHRAKVEAHVAAASRRARNCAPAGRGRRTLRWPRAVLSANDLRPGATGRWRIVQEETFGPILTVERFTDEAEAISLGNDTEYGLAAGVRTSDPARANVWCARCGTARCG